MDGTLIRKNYVEHIWLEAIPDIYARQKGMDIEDAKEYVMGEYMKVGEHAIEWYDIKYWLKKLELDCDWRKLLEEHAGMLEFYPEVSEVLDSLSRRYKLVITSNAAREFIEVENKAMGLEKKFSRIFSAVTDFGHTKKNPEVYESICKILNVKKEDIIHVGDSWEFDYVAPSEAGIRAFYLDRGGSMNGKNIVRDLKEFEMAVNNQYFKR